MAGNKNRTQLQALFKTGGKPSEEDFRDFIDSVLNINDDGLEKPPGVEIPLKIVAHGKTENLLDFYADELHAWRLNQKPTGANPGLNLETGGISKFFIESSTGNLGLSITQPTAKLHIRQSDSQDALRIDDQTSDNTPLIVNADGKVGIGKAIPTKVLDVKGDVAIAGPLSVDKNTTLRGNVGIGINPGSGSLKLNVAGNTALSGTLSVTQTSHLIGNVGIGTGPGAEKLKVDGALSISQTSTLTGNVGIGIGAHAAHKLTVYGGELALKVDNNENPQSILFQNSGGAYTWRIYRENIGGNKADLKIAGGASSDYTTLTDYIRIQNNGNTTFKSSILIDQNKYVKLGNAYFSSGGNYVHLATNEWFDGAKWQTSGNGALIQVADQTINFYRHKAGNHTTSMTIDKDGKVGIGTTDLGTSKLKIANTASDFSNFQFAGAGMGQLLFVGWSSGWNINTQTDGKNLYLNRDSGANSNVLIGRNGKELFVRGSDGNVGIGSTTPADKLDINGVLRFNGNANRRVYGASRAGSDAVVLDGRWNELEVKGRVIDWTGSNLHIGYENDHSQDSVYIGNGKLKAVEIQGGTSLTVGGDLTVKGTIKGKVWYSKEYVWTQGSGPVRMTTTAKTICFLMSVRGKFEGGGEHVDVYPANGYWHLGGSSAQKDVRATARCIGMP